MPQEPLAPTGIGQVLGALIPENAIVVYKALTTCRGFDTITLGAALHDRLTGTGGSIGFAVPVAVGAAVACKDRPVIVLEGDGSGMYTLHSLWTMAGESLPVTVILFANRVHQILRGGFANVGAGVPGQRQRPYLVGAPISRLGSARPRDGRRGHSGDRLEGLARTLQRSIASGGPTLIECVL